MSSKQRQEINNYISCGKYIEALEIISSIEKERSLVDDEILLKNYIQIFKYIDEGEFQKGIDCADELIKESKEKRNFLYELDAIIGKIENIINLGSIEEALKLIKNGVKLLRKIKGIPIIELKKRDAHLIFLKGRIYQNRLDLIETLELYKQSLGIRKEIDDKFGLIWSQLNLGTLMITTGDFKEAEKYINGSLEIAKELNNNVGIIWNLINLGWIKYHKREIKSALSFIKECFEISELKKYKYPLTLCYDLTGSCHLVKGNLNKALFFFLKSLYIRIKMKNNNLMIISYYDIGNVYSRKGELKRSLDYYNKGLSIPIYDKRKIFKPTYLSVMGKIYGQLGDFATAKTYLLEALNLLKDKKVFIYHHLNFSSSITKTLHYLIILCMNNNEIESANNYLEELKKLSVEYPRMKLIKQVYRLDRAIFLKSSIRLMDKMESWTIFKGIIEDSEINDYEITIEAMTNLCEILIYELELTGDKDILQEIEELSDKLLEIAKSQYLHNLLAETYFFKAKISLLNLDIDNTRYLLTKALKIAFKYDLKQLAKKISNEHDSLLVHLDEWEEKIKRKIPFLERIENIKHEFLFSATGRAQMEDLSIQNDNPIYFVILSSFNGRCIFSKTFQDISVNDGNLIASFISAINLFGKEAFSSSGTIDRIKHGEYLIVLQSKEDYIFGYVFKGQSYSAISKLESFIDQLEQLTDSFNILNVYIKSHREISIEIRSDIEKLVDKVLVYKSK